MGWQPCVHIVNDARVIDGGQKVISICRTLGDYAAFGVLISIMGSQKSAAEICRDNSIPISSTYKAIKKLQHEGLVKSSLAEKDGRRVALYTSKVKSLKITIQKDGARIEYFSHDSSGKGGLGSIELSGYEAQR